eukprot:TRINITY_DN14026_c0_g1_i1.p1 TRINITY_DN14026_c0_g1~~TRINITY_DN14026_c0_g1_i1.p1  ORF type:complete len:392 (+),score=89.03 TRINITY_DN14026_c0_g1_i1:256-1431(+)
MTAASIAARQYITKLSEIHPNPTIRVEFGKLRDDYEKKLWHQLTIRLEKLVNDPYFDNNQELGEFYDHFIKEFEGRINQLSLAKICLSISRQLKDPNQAILFIQHACSKIGEKEKEANSLVLSETASLNLRLNPPQIETAKNLTDKATAILENLTGADPAVYSSLYKALSTYYKVKVAPTEFFKNSLMYLVYTPLEQIPLEQQSNLAFDMGIAALISSDIYNFGELLAHPILQSLKGTKVEWLGNFLYAFNSGNIQEYENILKNYKSDFENTQALAGSAVLLREKISMLALMELVFNRTSDGRTLPFEVISKATTVALNEVELLVMKALSLKLIKGIIDEPNSTVTVNWVQPRVLNISQVSKMRDRLTQWEQTVSNTLTFVENETAPELLA